MICKNCGAEYPNSSLQCPYCHTENKKVAARRKKEILRSYDMEAEKIKEQAKEYPKKIVNKWTKYIFIGAGIVLAAGLIITIIAVFVTRLSSSYEYVKMQEHEQRLEELFVAGDYAEIVAYMQEEDLYGRDYEKYDQVQDAYTQCLDIEESITDIMTLDANLCTEREKWKVFVEYDIREILRSAEDLIYYYEVDCRDDVFRGNEEALEEICENGIELLKEFGFSENEMAEIALGRESTMQDVLYQKLEDYFWNKIERD